MGELKNHKTHLTSDISHGTKKKWKSKVVLKYLFSNWNFFLSDLRRHLDLQKLISPKSFISHSAIPHLEVNLTILSTKLILRMIHTIPSRSAPDQYLSIFDNDISTFSQNCSAMTTFHIYWGWKKYNVANEIKFPFFPDIS